jgi:hypothetical protein
MNNKKCPFCHNINCIKKGKRNGHQRWQCKNCKKKFQANKKVLPSKEELFCLYVFNKQTLTELSQKYHLKTKTIQTMFDGINIPTRKHKPRAISLAVDTTFFDNFAVVVFRDQKTRENLWWKFTDKESLEYYAEGKRFLEDLGYVFRSVTGDGLPGLPSVFPSIPFQYCHFHAKKNIRKYITKNPKLEAGIKLKFIMDSLKFYDQATFIGLLEEWELKHSYFLKEKTFHPGGSWSYTHGRLRSAIKSMKRMSSLLFTYQKLNFFIPITTNTLEGHFAHLKVRVGVHRGISDKRKKKLIEIILLNSSASYEKNIHKKLF